MNWPAVRLRLILGLVLVNVFLGFWLTPWGQTLTFGSDNHLVLVQPDSTTTRSLAELMVARAALPATLRKQLLALGVESIHITPSGQGYRLQGTIALPLSASYAVQWLATMMAALGLGQNRVASHSWVNGPNVYLQGNESLFGLRVLEASAFAGVNLKNGTVEADWTWFSARRTVREAALLPAAEALAGSIRASGTPVISLVYAEKGNSLKMVPAWQVQDVGEPPVVIDAITGLIMEGSQ